METEKDLEPGDVADGIMALVEYVKSAGRHQRSLYSALILTLKQVEEAFPDLDGQLLIQFNEAFDFLEKHIKVNINQISLETLTNAIYYFCKFRKGSEPLWNSFNMAALKNKDGMSMNQLTRCLLAVVMNSRSEPKENVMRALLDEILNKFSKAQAMDVYYLTMALSTNRIPESLVTSDLYYGIYLKSHELHQEYDLHQLSQIGIVLCSHRALEHIPDEFWASCMEPALLSNFQEFQ